jgi:hypothetical protein
MTEKELPPDLKGWWRITDTSQWVSDGLDDLGPALISVTGYADRLRMHRLLAYVNVVPTKAGASFIWKGAWEFDQMSGTGSVKLGKDGRLRGRIRIKGGVPHSRATGLVRQLPGTRRRHQSPATRAAEEPAQEEEVERRRWSSPGGASASCDDGPPGTGEEARADNRLVAVQNLVEFSDARRQLLVPIDDNYTSPSG